VLDRTMLHTQVLQTLEEHLFDNQRILQPAQLALVAEEFAQMADPAQVMTPNMGQRLNQQGIALSSLLSAGMTVVRGLLFAGQHEYALQSFQRLTEAIQQYHVAEVRRVYTEQQHIQEAVHRVLSERERQTEQLQAVIQELSTPIVPMYQGILVVPLVGTIDSQRANEIMSRLLNSITHYNASAILIDITGVAVVDTAIAQHLLQTTQAARLLGAEVVLVGINPEISQTIIQLGIDFRGIVTLSNLEQGIVYVLRRSGLGILPLPTSIQ
jgi:rsbT co-antagonist protein RsbR